MGRLRLFDVRAAACCTLAVLTACSASLNESLEGRSCAPDGKCLAGYVCSAERECVRPSRSDRASAAGRPGLRTREKEPDAAVAVPDSEVERDAAAAGTPARRAEPPPSQPGDPTMTSAPPQASGDVVDPSSVAGAGGAAGSTEAGAAGMLVAGASGTSAGAGGSSVAGGGAAGQSAPTPPPAARPAAPSCAAPLKMCGMSCVDLDNDPKHCGKCATKCDDKKSCVSGKCEELDDVDKGKPGGGKD
jgi:Stigma-specific protein, Stig1